MTRGPFSTQASKNVIQSEVYSNSVGDDKVLSEDRVMKSYPIQNMRASWDGEVEHSKSNEHTVADSTAGTFL